MARPLAYEQAMITGNAYGPDIYSYWRSYDILIVWTRREENRTMGWNKPETTIFGKFT